MLRGIEFQLPGTTDAAGRRRGRDFVYQLPGTTDAAGRRNVQELLYQLPGTTDAANRRLVWRRQSETGPFDWPTLISPRCSTDTYSSVIPQVNVEGSGNAWTPMASGVLLTRPGIDFGPPEGVIRHWLRVGTGVVDYLGEETFSDGFILVFGQNFPIGTVISIGTAMRYQNTTSCWVVYEATFTISGTAWFPMTFVPG